MRHNFHFTTEVRYPFAYTEGDSYTITFVGDDDAWVFVNRRLALDLGGIHAPAEGSITIDEDSAADFGLTDGNRYELAVFHAERQTESSTFLVSPKGFVRGRSTCRPL